MFITKADFFPREDTSCRDVQIKIEKKGKNIFVDGKKASMKRKGLQLIFKVHGEGEYIIIDKRHKPSLPTTEMFKKLS